MRTEPDDQAEPESRAWLAWLAEPADPAAGVRRREGRCRCGAAVVGYRVHVGWYCAVAFFEPYDRGRVAPHRCPFEAPFIVE